jgi:iron complex outermembrane receptor protein
VGWETEVLAERELGAFGKVTGFANYTYVYNLNETTADPLLSASPGQLTWAPAHSAKAGVNYSIGNLNVALQGLYQGAVFRRASDNLTDMYIDARPALVGSWTKFDIYARYRVFDWATLGARIANIFDTRGFMLKTGDFPFDYQVEGRRILGTLEIEL